MEGWEWKLLQAVEENDIILPPTKHQEFDSLENGTAERKEQSHGKGALLLLEEMYSHCDGQPPSLWDSDHDGHKTHFQQLLSTLAAGEEYIIAGTTTLSMVLRFLQFGQMNQNFAFGQFTLNCKSLCGKINKQRNSVMQLEVVRKNSIIQIEDFMDHKERISCLLILQLL